MTTEAGRVLVVDDDEDLRQAHVETLVLAGFETTGVWCADEALPRLEAEQPHVILCDIRMPGMDGLEFQKRVAAIDPTLPVILMTGHGDIEMAVSALQRGVFDFLPKPFGADRLLPVVQRALRQRLLVLENRRLTRLLEQADEEAGRTGLIGQSPSIVRLRSNLAQIARAEVEVLIEGESGVGKETAARALHRLSSRRGRPFVTVNCAALPETVLEAELFGRLPASGYGRRTGGRARDADGGVLFLDEVEFLPLPLQIKVLHLIETGQIPGENDLPLNLRVLTSTRVDLDAAAKAGAFRSDLYYRLSAITLKVPPLRERREDIPLIFRHLVSHAAARQRRPEPPVDDVMDAHLIVRDWPGNVRELAQIAERFVTGLSFADHHSSDGPETLNDRVEAFESRIMDETLKSTRGDVQTAMMRLALPRKTFYAKVKRHGLILNSYRTKSG